MAGRTRSTNSLMPQQNCGTGPIYLSPALETGQNDRVLKRWLSAAALKTSGSMAPGQKPRCPKSSMPVTSEQQSYRITPRFEPCTQTRYLITCHVRGQSFSPLTLLPEHWCATRQRPGSSPSRKTLKLLLQQFDSWRITPKPEPKWL